MQCPVERATKRVREQRVATDQRSYPLLEGKRPLCFTRFVPLRRPNEGVGTWRRYYQRWPDVTLHAIDPALVELLPELRRERGESRLTASLV
jgi:hypothetical protein